MSDMPPSKADDSRQPVAPLREVRYSLKAMIAEVKEERKHSALGRELVDSTEIKKMFGHRKRKKVKKKADE